MGMIVCFCNPFNEEAVEKHLDTLDGKQVPLIEIYRVCSGGKNPACGKCVRQTLADVVDRHSGQNNPQPS
jgi:bacterioferritin-associated ferredoxin